ncbi:MAG: AAA family ATPase [Deltaproteobacteria bacterium]|nr:AAA family ATPase [Deltaproteobacteria bacterium]
MDRFEDLRRFYTAHIPGAKIEGSILSAPCPFCSSGDRERKGAVLVYLDPESFFCGYFRCTNRCRPGGFAPYFARLAGVDPGEVPGYDPDREPYVRDVSFPSRNINGDVKRFGALLGETELARFQGFGVSRAVIDEMRIGYNGRYLVYPYFQEDGNCYAARCVLPAKEEDSFWHGDERFFAREFQVFNVQEIERCEQGALFLAEGEDNLLALRELGYPGIAVPTFSELEVLGPDQLAQVNHILVVIRQSPEGRMAVQALATRLGYKTRILRWSSERKRGYDLCRLAREKGEGFRAAVTSMVRASRSFSPFSSPEKEHHRFSELLEREKGKELIGLPTGFAKMDRALNGLRGITIVGGPPKAGKSCFFMHMSTGMARAGTPVIYYDFENGRHKIYMRTLCRMSRLSEGQIRMEDLDPEARDRLDQARSEMKEMLTHFRVVTDRKLGPDIMRRQIDFLQHETRKDYALVVVDSLHKLPFKNLSERRTGIDEWLRHMESIRDEKNVSFLVVSELSRGEGGHYNDKPDLGSFKESGDIEYSADNAMVLSPQWDPLDPSTAERRINSLWLVASRENSPGLVADYLLEYPYWGFKEL